MTQVFVGEISMDGKRIVFLRRDKDPAKDLLWVAYIDGSDEQIIPLQKSAYRIGAYHWSPDGKRWRWL
jgi:hypothetical protein